jgi:hypothetical protein
VENKLADCGIGIADWGFITISVCYLQYMAKTTRHRNKSPIPNPKFEFPIFFVFFRKQGMFVFE